MTLKKLLVSIAVLICASVSAKAGLFDDDRVQVSYKVSVAAATNSTSTILIDLSDTTNWPHKETRELNVNAIRVSIDKLATTTCTVKLGIVTEVNVATGSVKYFYAVESSSNVSHTNSNQVSNLGTSFYRLRVDPSGSDSPGLTPYLLSNDTVIGSTTYQTDVRLPSPVGNGFPGVGDVVLVITKDIVNALVVTVDLIYSSDR